METNQLTQTTVVNSQDGVGSAQGEGLSINPSYKGSLSAKDLDKTQKRYPEFLKIEKETGVPWKVVAALDCAGVGYLVLEKAAKFIQSSCQENGASISPSSSRSDLLNLLNQAMSKMNPQDANYKTLDLAKIYYDEIGRAFLGVQ